MTKLDRLERFILNVNNQCNKTIVNTKKAIVSFAIKVLIRPVCNVLAKLQICNATFLASNLLIFALMLTNFLSLAAQANTDQSPEALFKQGLSEFHLNKFVSATKIFQDLLAKEPNNPAVLSNLGLCSVKINQPGWALAYFRKALYLDSGLTEARSGLMEALSKLEVKELPRQNNWFESFRNSFLVKVPIDFVLLLTLLTLLLAGWKIIAFFGLRRRKIREGEEAPAWPIYIFVVTLVFAMFVAVAILKIYDIYIVSRGTVIVKKATLSPAPEVEQPALFEIFEGLEVEVIGSSGDFYQVQYPGGASGWIAKKNLYITQ